MMELGFARGAWLLRGLVFLVASAMWKRWRCRGIISPSFFRSPMAIYSDVNGEAVETCLGVEGQRIINIFRVVMLLTLLISRKMIFGRNLSIARVAGGGKEGYVVGAGVG
jgi:hypothetical protein